MPKQFQLTQEFLGYVNKRDITNISPGHLVSGSKNVVTNDGERIQARKGYTLDGAANTSRNPIEASHEWRSHSEVELPVRAYDDKLEFRHTDGTWYEVEQSGGSAFTSVAFHFVEYWDTTEGEDILLFINGTTNVFSWSGGRAEVDITGSTSNTLKLQDTTTTWAAERFINTGTDYDKKLTIDGTEYTYTGGEETDTLTGVSPDPTAGGHSDGDLAIQTITVHAGVPTSDFSPDLIGIRNNQVWYGNTQNRQMYVSAQNDFDDVSFSTPRAVGEGAIFTLDAAPTGMVVQEDNMYVAAGDSRWYQISFLVSDDNQKELPTVSPLKTATKGAAQSQGMIEKIKNSAVFISFEPTLDELGRVENINTPQASPLSDLIKNDFDDYDFTNAHIKYFKNNIYIAIPAESLVLIYNLEKAHWEPPQTLPIRRLAIIGNSLYGHSSLVSETYNLFDGRNDNGNPIEAVARFSYVNFGDRVNLKRFIEMYTEGYISSNTDLTLAIRYDYLGHGGIIEYGIEGDDDAILFGIGEDASLGKSALGKRPLGSTLDDPDDGGELPLKFRQINTGVGTDFHEVQFEYSSNQEDANWELLAVGPSAIEASSQPISIKK